MAMAVRWPGLCVLVPSSGREENDDLSFSHNLAGCGVGSLLFRCAWMAYSMAHLRILLLF